MSTAGTSDDRPDADNCALVDESEPDRDVPAKSGGGQHTNPLDIACVND
jgi:hypothetical protein